MITFFNQIFRPHVLLYRLLAFAAFLYLLVAPLTYHPDNKLVLNWASQEEGRVWNIWEHELEGIPQFNYPPFHYYLDKLQFFIAKPIGGEGFSEWLSTQNSTDHNEPLLARYSLALKFPLILFTLLAGCLLYIIALQAGSTKRQASFVSAAWLFNPVILYSVAFMGQNDVMAIVFFLGGWIVLNTGNWVRASILFGLATSIKMFPLLWLPFLLLGESRFSWKQRLMTFFASAGVYVLTLLPFLANPVFRGAVLTSGIDRFFIARFDLGYGKEIFLVPILLLFVVLGAFQLRQRKKWKVSIFVQTTILLLMNVIFLFFNHFNPQWFTWIVPFWALWVFWQKKEHLALIAFFTLSVLFAWAGIIFFFRDSALSFGLLTPLNPDLAVLPALHDLFLQKGIHISLYSNYAHTWLAGIAGVLLVLWLQGKLVTENFQWLPVELPKIRLKKIWAVPMVFLLGLVGIFLSYFVTHLLPVPVSGPSQTIVEYPFFREPVEQTFVAEKNGLRRITLYFSNEDLENKDEYRFVLRPQHDQTILWQQVFNGFNIGYESSLRFDFPPQVDSQGKTYSLEVIPASQSAEPLRIGSQSIEEPNNFAYRLEYAKPTGSALFPYAFEQAQERTFFLIQQLGGLFVVLFLLLLIAL